MLALSTYQQPSRSSKNQNQHEHIKKISCVTKKITDRVVVLQMSGERHLNFGTFLRVAGGSVSSIGHTLAEQLEQARILANSTIKDVYVDLGYRGVV